MRLVFSIFALCLPSCGGSGADVPSEAPAPAPQAAVPAPTAAAEVAPDAESPVLDDASAETLAKADAMDGTEDKVVAKCGLCALHMEGDETHAVTMGDYTLHMCSSACQESWEKDPAGSLAKLAEAAQ